LHNSTPPLRRRRNALAHRRLTSCAHPRHERRHHRDRGEIEGFLAAGASRDALLAASITEAVAGAGSLGGVKFSEAAAERDAELVLIMNETRRGCPSRERR